MTQWFFLAFAILFASNSQAAIKLDKIKLPPGFKIELLARVPNARQMALSPYGTIYVGSRGEGKVYAVIRDKLKTKEVVVLTKGQNMPVGVAFFENDLYFSAVSKIFRLPQIEDKLKKPPQPLLVSDKFPSETHHGWKYIAFGPDQKLYVPVGAPCNICDRNPQYSNIMRMNKDGSELEVYAQGVRNTVGFAWHPENKELWFTDNGRDMMGDDVPPCELNHATSKGQHFGYPYCHGNDILDPDFGKNKNCSDYRKPAQNLGPHVAPLGMKFYTGMMFPKEYRNQIFIAEHGSWNRSKKIGYRVTLVKLENGEAKSYEPFATGWLQGESAWGRPVDVIVDLDGALLVSDDEAGAIYRISSKP